MKNNRRVSAFSLIEISIVILIIGILVAGVTQSSRLLAQAKLSGARTLTQSSPVSSIKNLSLWIESTSDSSFQTADLDDGTVLTIWKDINPQSVTRAHFDTASGSPTYKTNIINGIPAVLFDGSTTYFSTANFSNLSTAATVFAVVKLPSTLASKPLLSKRPAAGGTAYPNIELSTSSTVGWQYQDGSSSAYVPVSTSVPTAASNAYVLSVVYTSNSASGAGTSTSSGYAFFQNGGTSAYTGATYGATTGNSPNAAVTDALYLGKQGLTTSPTFFGGYIGEVIVFDRALRKEERQSIEAYLGKKWGITMTVASY